MAYLLVKIGMFGEERYESTFFQRQVNLVALAG
jgi:hypothetical protein